MAECQATALLDVPASSRASPLLHLIFVVHKIIVLFEPVV
jgi:hypothetical protein